MSSVTAELIEHIFLRPRMFCDAANLRELLMFVAGVCCGRNPPHGGGCLPGFDDHIRGRFRAASGVPWERVVLDALGDRPYLEASEVIAGLLRDWRAGGGGAGDA